MANIRKGEAPVKIQGVDFVLRFDMNAFAELEGALNEPLHAILAEAETKMSFRFVRAALYAALCHDRRFKGKWTLERAGNMLTNENIAEITQALIGALIAAMTGKTVAELQTESKPEEGIGSEAASPFDDSIGTSTP